MTVSPTARLTKPMAVLAVHPHHRHWMEVRALAVDGVEYAKARQRPGRPRTGTPPDKRESSSKARKDKGGQKGKKEVKVEKKEKKTKTMGDGAGSLDAALVTAAITPAAEREWKPTRSVLQQGARETGVKVGGHVPGQG